MDVLQAITGLGAAAGAVYTVYLFLKDRKEERAHNAKDRLLFIEDRKQDRTVWENHLSQSIKVQSETASVIGDLVTAIKLMQNENQSGMTWARDAMQSLIREVGRSQPVKSKTKPD